MNNVVLGALIGGGGSLAGVFISQTMSFLLERRSEGAGYRRDLYSRAVDARHEAVTRVFRLAQSLAVAQGVREAGLLDRDLSQLRDEVVDLMYWHMGHVAYLDAQSIAKLDNFIGGCFNCIHSNSSSEAWDPVKEASEVVTSLLKGMDVKHMDGGRAAEWIQRVVGRNDA